MSAKRRYRKISPFEWIYISATTRFPPFAVQLMLEGETLPPLRELEDALAIAAEANVGTRLVVDGRWWVDSERVPAIRQVSPSETPCLSHSLFHEAFSLIDTPPIEILYWAGVGLVFRCSHALMDAGGLIFFAEKTALQPQNLARAE
jgi:hypothetical protein